MEEFIKYLKEQVSHDKFNIMAAVSSYKAFNATDDIEPITITAIRNSLLSNGAEKLLETRILKRYGVNWEQINMILAGKQSATFALNTYMNQYINENTYAFTIKGAEFEYDHDTDSWTVKILGEVDLYRFK